MPLGGASANTLIIISAGSPELFTTQLRYHHVLSFSDACRLQIILIFFFFFFSFFSPRTHRLLSSCDIFIMNIPRLACGSQYGILVCINTNWPRFVASNLALFKLPRSVLGEKYSYSGNLDRFYSFTEISRDGERRNKKLRK